MERTREAIRENEELGEWATCRQFGRSRGRGVMARGCGLSEEVLTRESEGRKIVDSRELAGFEERTSQKVRLVLAPVGIRG